MQRQTLRGSPKLLCSFTVTEETRLCVSEDFSHTHGMYGTCMRYQKNLRGVAVGWSSRRKKPNATSLSVKKRSFFEWASERRGRKRGLAYISTLLKSENVHLLRPLLTLNTPSWKKALVTSSPFQVFPSGKSSKKSLKRGNNTKDLFFTRIPLTCFAYLTCFHYALIPSPFSEGPEPEPG